MGPAARRAWVRAALGVAAGRLLDPQPVEDVGVGLVISASASIVNLAVGLLLLRTGRSQRSITLEANGKHLMTDVWTSAGVIAGVAAVAAVAATGWDTLDPLIALAVAANIVVAGVGLVRRSVGGLMDQALGEEEQRAIAEALRGFEGDGLRFHALRTRQAGGAPSSPSTSSSPAPGPSRRATTRPSASRPPSASVSPYAAVFTHLEPIEDPRSYADTALERDGA